MRKRAMTQIAPWWAFTDEGDLTPAAREIDAQLDGLIGKLRRGGDFSGKLGDILFLTQLTGAPRRACS